MDPSEELDMSLEGRFRAKHLCEFELSFRVDLTGEEEMLYQASGTSEVAYLFITYSGSCS